MLTVVLPVLTGLFTAVLVTALTPLGDWLKELVSPTLATVQGVVHMHGRPVPDATVLVDGEQRGATATDGSFLVTDLRRGRHELAVQVLGARTHQGVFSVKRGSEEKELPTIELVPSLRLAGEVVISLQGPSAVLYDMAAWLEGDQEVLGAVDRVTFTLPGRLQPQPLASTSKESRFCVAASRRITITDLAPGAVAARVSLQDGGSLQLSVADPQQLEMGVRPTGCSTISQPVPPTTTTSQPASTLPNPATSVPPLTSVPTALIRLTPARGLPGSEVRVSGSGFGPAERIAFTVGATPAAATGTTDPNGAFADVSVRVPSTWPGTSRPVTVTVTATGAASGRTASLPFEIVGPALRLARTPSAGKIYVEGAGFRAAEEVELCSVTDQPRGCEKVRADGLGVFCLDSLVLQPLPTATEPTSYTITAQGDQGSSTSASLRTPAPWTTEARLCP